LGPSVRKLGMSRYRLVFADGQALRIALEFDRVDMRATGVEIESDTAGEHGVQHVPVDSQIGLANLAWSACIITYTPNLLGEVKNAILPPADLIGSRLAQK